MHCRYIQHINMFPNSFLRAKGRFCPQTGIVYLIILNSPEPWILVKIKVWWFWNNTVDGRNPASVHMENIPFFIGFHGHQVVQDFFHQQYVLKFETWIDASWRIHYQTTILGSKFAKKKCPHECHLTYLNPSGQISIIPKPELRGFWGSSLIKPPFRVTSAEPIKTGVLDGKSVAPNTLSCVGGSSFQQHIFGWKKKQQNG